MVKILNRSRDFVINSLEAGKITLAVVGLGYVGLPLAALFSSKGAQVIGCDVRKDIVEKISGGESPIAEHDVSDLFGTRANPQKVKCPNCAVQLFESGGEVFCPHCLRIAEVKEGSARLLSKYVSEKRVSSKKPEKLEKLIQSSLDKGTLTLSSDTEDAVKRADVVLITVGTPIDDNRRPDTKALSSASGDIGKGLTEKTLVILKSTVSPGTTENLVAPILKKESGLLPGRDFGLAHMPERIKEGMALYEFQTLPRIVAGIDDRSTEAAASLFSIFPAPIYKFSKPVVTESSKLFENIYRDVNIALANEFALVSEVLGLDVMEVIEAAHTDPKTHILTPGPGVGGYCLPKDPYYLLTPASDNGFKSRIIQIARDVNDDIPNHIVTLIEDSLKEAGLEIRGTTIGILGLAFKGNSGDLRNTPLISIIETLRAKGGRIVAYDPLVNPQEAEEYFGKDLLASSMEEIVKESVCLVFAADHLEFRKIDISNILRQASKLKSVVDSRNIINRSQLQEYGVIYRGLGKGAL